jgi:hypothetical protein
MRRAYVRTEALRFRPGSMALRGTFVRWRFEIGVATKRMTERKSRGTKNTKQEQELLFFFALFVRFVATPVLVLRLRRYLPTPEVPL